MLSNFEILTLFTVILCFVIIALLFALFCHVGEFLENYKARQNRCGNLQVSGFIIKQEIYPKGRISRQKTYEIKQQSQRDYLLTDNSRGFKVHKSCQSTPRSPHQQAAYSSQGIDQDSGHPSGTQASHPRNSVITVAPRNPVFVLPKITLLSANSWVLSELTKQCWPQCYFLILNLQVIKKATDPLINANSAGPLLTYCVLWLFLTPHR